MSTAGEQKANDTRNRFRVPRVTSLMPVDRITTPLLRALFVQQYFVECAKASPEYTIAATEQLRKLRADFEALKPNEEILGCRNWTAYVENVLNISMRAAQYRLSGGNPNKNRKRKPRGYKPGYCFQVVEVMFKTADDAQRFSDLVGQQITPKTTFIWFPQAEQTEEVA